MARTADPANWLVRGGLVDATQRLLLANAGKTERRGDFDAQIGRSILAQLVCSKSSRDEEQETCEYAAQLINYSARLMRHNSTIPEGT
jgi:hypothetical protein